MSKLRAAILATALMGAIAMPVDPAAAEEVATASCPGPATSNRQFGAAPGAGDNRFAQTFTVQDTGRLTTVELGVLTGGAPASWLVEILATVAGTPVDSVLSSASFAEPTNPTTGNVIAHPSPPLDVAPGQEYALAISRPGSDTIGVGTVTGDPCPGDFFTGTPAFFPESSPAGDEMVLTAYVTPPPPRPSEPSNDFSFGKVKKNKRKGTAKLTVEVPGAGDLELTKTKKVKAAEARAEAAGDVKLVVKPKGKAKKRVRKRGKAKVAAEVTYTPDGGQPNTESEKLKLVKK